MNRPTDYDLGCITFNDSPENYFCTAFNDGETPLVIAQRLQWEGVHIVFFEELDCDPFYAAFSKGEGRPEWYVLASVLAPNEEIESLVKKVLSFRD